MGRAARGFALLSAMKESRALDISGDGRIDEVVIFEVLSVLSQPFPATFNTQFVDLAGIN